MTTTARSEPVVGLPPAARPAWTFDRPLQWAIALLTALLVLAPLGPIVYQSFLDQPLFEAEKQLTLGNYTRVLSSPEFWSIFATTLVFAVASTALAVLLGTAFAVILTRTDVPTAGVLSAVVLFPFYVSPLVLAFAWAIVYGPAGYVTLFVRTLTGVTPWNLYSLTGIALVGAVYYLPYPFLYATGSLALTDPQLEDAGRIAGAGPLRTLWSITVPLLRPAIAYGALLTVVSAVELLSVPLVLGSPVGIQVLSTYLYKLGLVGGGIDYGGIAAISVLMLLVITALVWLQVRLVGAGASLCDGWRQGDPGAAARARPLAVAAGAAGVGVRDRVRAAPAGRDHRPVGDCLPEPIGEPAHGAHE
ncbi:MAG: hypothetical protein KatS3mg061_0053 [Dehalococcoidia bacterium]|nr:MAG: hypothetical protein KatS3mg061_0053 [Dehalococcoidia bacterium]